MFEGVVQCSVFQVSAQEFRRVVTAVLDFGVISASW